VFHIKPESSDNFIITAETGAKNKFLHLGLFTLTNKSTVALYRSSSKK
jgi:hypothetical protein